MFLRNYFRNFFSKHWLVFGMIGVFLPILYQCAPQQNYTKGGKGFRPYPIQKAAYSLKVPTKSRRIALLIGINNYKDKAWHSLRFASKDANDLAKVLRGKKKNGFDKILLYTAKKQTTRLAVLRAFQTLQKENYRADDTIFVYISAHGTLARNKKHNLQRYLVTQDTRSQNVSDTAISVKWLKSRFGQLKSQRKVLLLATCHSGAGKSRLNRQLRSELRTLKGSFFAKPLEAVSRATIFLGVCGFGETAQESPKLKNDIYTHFFIKALKNQYDANSDGAITVSEAHDYAKELTYLHTHGNQRPYAESDILGTDPIVLVGKKKRPGKPIIFAYNERFRGVEVRVNGTPKGAFPKGISIPTGKQRVTLIDASKSKVLFDGIVRFKAGERIDARELFDRQQYNYAFAIKGGYQFFLLGSSGDRLSQSLPLLGLELKLHRPFNAPIDFRFEFAFSRDSHVLEEQDNRPQTVNELLFGASAVYLWQIRSLSFYVGPRLSAIYLKRRSDLHKDVNDFFFSFQPGLVFGTEFRFFSRWSFFSEARLNYMYVTQENSPPRHQGSYEILGGLFFHF